jgi:hypothetical protein
VRPIDHIFQFHKALRRELREIEASAVAFQVATEEATSAGGFDAAIQELEAKFQFLRGIYRAHSKAEDEIVFPALEAKETLHNVSHAYTLDHKEEEQYFDELAAVRTAARSTAADHSRPLIVSLGRLLGWPLCRGQPLAQSVRSIPVTVTCGCRCPRPPSPFPFHVVLTIASQPPPLSLERRCWPRSKEPGSCRRCASTPPPSPACAPP